MFIGEILSSIPVSNKIFVLIGIAEQLISVLQSCLCMLKNCNCFNIFGQQCQLLCKLAKNITLWIYMYFQLFSDCHKIVNMKLMYTVLTE